MASSRRIGGRRLHRGVLPRQHSVEHIVCAGGASWRRSGSVRLELSMQVGGHMGACCVQPVGLSAHSMPHSVLSSVAVVLIAMHAVVAVPSVRSIAVTHSVVRLAALHTVPGIRLWVLRIVCCIVAGRSCIWVLGVVGRSRCVVVAVMLQWTGRGRWEERIAFASVTAEGSRQERAVELGSCQGPAQPLAPTRSSPIRTPQVPTLTHPAPTSCTQAHLRICICMLSIGSRIVVLPIVGGGCRIMVAGCRLVVSVVGCCCRVVPVGLRCGVLPVRRGIVLPISGCCIVLRAISCSVVLRAVRGRCIVLPISGRGIVLRAIRCSRIVL